MDEVSKKIKVISSKINKIVNNFNKHNIDGYVVPKNDNFFSEYVSHDRLNIISNFTGSAGFAIIFKNKNYLFVDGRYTLQAKKESGKNFKIIEFPQFLPKNLFKNVEVFNFGLSNSERKVGIRSMIKNGFVQSNSA